MTFFATESQVVNIMQMQTFTCRVSVHEFKWSVHSVTLVGISHGIQSIFLYVLPNELIFRNYNNDVTTSITMVTIVPLHNHKCTIA